MQELIFTNEVKEAVDRLIERMAPDRVAFLCDANTYWIAEEIAPEGSEIMRIGAGDENKNLDSVIAAWTALSRGGYTRRSLLVNVGGGMITDLGGFAAACFKRGICFINVPTTLLGAVDAAVGGKTGVNFLDFKNELGAFCEAEAVVISTRFFATLPAAELRSGFAEMLKHGLISDRGVYKRLMGFDIVGADLDLLLPLLQESIEVKRRIVAKDPRERGIRRALNLGHTVGHAFESYALESGKPIPHGFAVAHGLLVEMVLSHLQLGFPSSELHRYAALLREAYSPAPAISCKDYDALLGLMTHDKKNRSAGEINFTLLRRPGKPAINRTATSDEIRTALDLYRDLLGL